MKLFVAEVSCMCPYPKTFTYRIEARTMGRAYDFAWRLVRKEPQLKNKRDDVMTIKMIPA